MWNDSWTYGLFSMLSNQGLSAFKFTCSSYVWAMMMCISSFAFCLQPVYGGGSIVNPEWLSMFEIALICISDMSNDFDIYFTKRGNAMRSTQPFRMTADSLTLMFWIAPLAESGDNPVQLRLRWVDTEWLCLWQFTCKLEQKPLANAVSPTVLQSDEIHSLLTSVTFSPPMPSKLC